MPRATFYNYFEDKFDLLRYVFRLVAQEIIPKEATDSIDSAIKLFEKLINIVETSDNYLSRIVSANYNGIFFSEIKQFVYEQLLLRFERDMKRGITFNIDIKMLSEFLANGYVYSAKTIIEHQNGIDINELREGIMKVTLSTYTSFTNLLNG